MFHDSTAWTRTTRAYLRGNQTFADKEISSEHFTKMKAGFHTQLSKNLMSNVDACSLKLFTADFLFGFHIPGR